MKGKGKRLGAAYRIKYWRFHFQTLEIVQKRSKSQGAEHGADRDTRPAYEKKEGGSRGVDVVLGGTVWGKNLVGLESLGWKGSGPSDQEKGERDNHAGRGFGTRRTSTLATSCGPGKVPRSNSRIQRRLHQKRGKRRIRKGAN